MLSEIRSSDSYYDLKENIGNVLYKLPKGDKIVGAIKKTKSNLKQVILHDSMFESMGIYYLGPVDGHDMDKLIKILNVAKRIKGPVLVHVVTQKGRGYKPAERNPSKFHGIGPFDVKTGCEINQLDVPTYSKVFSEAICEIGKKDRMVAAITAAMPDGVGLTKFSKWFPDRFFDVGIAEAHAVTFAAGLAAGGLNYVHQNQSGSVLADSAHVEKVEYLEKLIDQEYLGDVDQDKLAEGIYAGLIYGLGDVYSRYYTAEEYAQETATTDGSYVGIGVSIQKNKNGGVQIAECYEGGSGKKAGLIVGDVITAIDDTDVTDMELSEVVSLIKENKDKNIVLTVQREDEETPLQITVEVTDVELPAVFSEMLDDETGYIQITQFTGVAPQQYKDAFVDLKQKGMQKLVVDLRDNPGGLLTSVCEILRDILPEGLIVYTEDKDGNREEETCDGKNELHMPLAVLVNESSASASEIFAGAVQDYGIGKIVGTTTYGKGVVQELRQLRDGSAVKLTVSNYYTPKGNSINKVGIKPDIEVKLASELLNKTEISHEEDNQLQEALKTLQ